MAKNSDMYDANSEANTIIVYKIVKAKAIRSERKYNFKKY